VRAPRSSWTGGTRAALARRFAGTPISPPSRWVRAWVADAFQAGQGRTFTTAYNADSTYRRARADADQEATAAALDRRAAIALAYLGRPTIGNPEFSKLDEDDRGSERQPEAMVRLGIAAAGVDTAATPLERMLSRLRKGARVPPDSFASVLEVWLAASRDATPQQGAGALFAADVLLRYVSVEHDLV
jgi:hypothetical protein